jgi:hypothetical protein
LKLLTRTVLLKSEEVLERLEVGIEGPRARPAQPRLFFSCNPRPRVASASSVFWIEFDGSVAAAETKAEIVRQSTAGATGPQGPPGPSGANFYVHDQQVPQSTWTITHNLNNFPNVTVVDSALTEVIGDVVYINSNAIQVSFASPFSGNAHLS